MNDDRIKSGSDPDHVARVLAVREHLGLGEDVRVEDLSPLEWLKLQAASARADLVAAKSRVTVAQAEEESAWDRWHQAMVVLENAEDEEGKDGAD